MIDKQLGVATPSGGRDAYDGWTGLPLGNNSGYFRTAQANGQSWLVTPLGNAYFSIGVNLLTYGSKPWVDNSYDQRMFVRYRNNPQAWAHDVTAQLRGWSFNTIGGFSGVEVRNNGMSETRVLNLTSIAIKPPYNVRAVNGNFADVFDAAFDVACQQIAASLISPRDITDRWLIGYFLDNELHWYQNGVYRDTANATVVENFIALPASAAGKQSWTNLLFVRYQTIQALNAAWATNYTSFSGPEPTSIINTSVITAPAAVADKYSFLSMVAERYYSVASGAVRARDINHLILGDRYLGSPTYQQVAAAAAKYVDVITQNLYDRVADNIKLDNLDFLGQFGKPVLISEFSCRSAASGMPNQPDVLVPLVASDLERAALYELVLQEAARRPFMVGAHWFMHADRAILDTHLTGGYYGHHNWGLVDIDNRPYSGLTDRATRYNTAIYQQKVGIPTPTIPPPVPLAPLYATPVFTPNPTFRWRAVAGQATYVWQASRTPDFAVAQTVGVSSTSYTATLPFDPGRWYWRVRVATNDNADFAYTAPIPFYVLRQTAQLAVNNFEQPADVTLRGQGTPYRWVAEVDGDLSLVGTRTLGVTEGQQAGLVTFSGQTNGQADHYSWALLSLYPSGTAFIPRDWRGYNYFTIDFTNPDADTPAPSVGFGFNDDAGRGSGTAQPIPIRSGTTQLYLSIDAAVAAGMNPAQMANSGLGARRPNAGSRLVLDNIAIRQISRDSFDQPAINPAVRDAGYSGTLIVDWRSYRPAPSTVAYNVYVSDTPTRPSTPTIRIEASSPYTLLRCRLAPNQPGADPNGFFILNNGQTYYVSVVAVDFWGNLGTLGPVVAGVPTNGGAIFADIPANNFAYPFITEVAALGIMSGSGNGNFSPNAATTREQFCKIITVARNWPLVNPAQPSFADAGIGNPLYRYIETAVAHQAISGANPNDCRAKGQSVPCFLPHEPITRVQLAIVLTKAFGWPIEVRGQHYSDMPPSAFGYAEVETCFSRGVMSGIAPNLFAPNQPASRAQVATVIYNALRQFRDVLIFPPPQIPSGMEGNNP